MDIYKSAIRDVLGVVNFGVGIMLWTTLYSKWRLLPFGNWVYVFLGNAFLLAGLHRLSKMGWVHFSINDRSWMVLGVVFSGSIALGLIVRERAIAQQKHERNSYKMPSL